MPHVVLPWLQATNIFARLEAHFPNKKHGSIIRKNLFLFQPALCKLEVGHKQTMVSARLWFPTGLKLQQLIQYMKVTNTKKHV